MLFNNYSQDDGHYIARGDSEAWATTHKSKLFVVDECKTHIMF